MKEPTITVIIPSISSPTLPVALASALYQPIGPNDQVIVVGDVNNPHINRNPSAREMTLRYGPQFEYIEYIGESCWGNPNRNYALEFARGDYIVWMDEDDLHMPNTFNHIKQTAMANPDKILMYQFIHPCAGRLPREHVIACAWIGGHCIVAPNIPEKLGRWGMRYEGDFDFIRSTVDLWGEDNIVWVDEVIAHCRPIEEHYWWRR